MYKLVIQDDEGKTTVVPLVRDELTIGRKEGNTIRLTERNVSRRHARVTRQNGTITIEDLDSYNGVRVNGSRIQGKAEIHVSDRVQIGDYLIEIKSEAKAQGETQPVPMPSAPLVTDGTGSEAVTVPIPQVPDDAPTAIVQRPDPDPAMLDAETQVAVKPVPGPSGRLVILSAELAGREFELDKPSMVIGRTDENDIWINHRSISRHHAKIERHGDRYSIIDLQSSNGVRVNGEDYGNVELRRGDIVDLGHVRLRFIEPGEDFVFGRDAQPVDLTADLSRRGGLWFILLVLVIGLAAAAYFVFKGESKDEGQRHATGPAKARIDAAAATDVEPAIDAAEETPPSADIADLLAKATEARDSESWDEMLRFSEMALEIDPKHKKALALAEQAQAEKINQEIFERFQAAAAARKYADVAETFDSLDRDSIYRARAQAEHDALRADYEKSVVSRARELAGKDDCRGIAKLLRSIPPTWPDVTEAVRSIRCKVAVKDPDPPVDPPANEPSFEELYEEVRDAWRNGQYGKAKRSCTKALKKKPGDQETLKACAIVACNLPDVSLAKRYLNKLRSNEDRNVVLSLCSTAGITDM